MALLLELTRNPEETWFKEFIGALSKIPHYSTMVNHILKAYRVTCVGGSKEF